MRQISALTLGSKVRFEDRWHGTLAGFEVDEGWEVVNVLVQSGMLFVKSSVKLPFAIAGEWSDDHLALDCDSFKALAREVPPIAAPARPLSAETPVAMAGARLAGLLVARDDRRATEVLLREGVAGPTYRVRVDQAQFEGKTLTLAVQMENVPLYRSDDDIQAAVAQAVTADHLLLADEKRTIVVESSAGTVTLRGNVRNRPARERAQQIAAGARGVLAVRNEMVEDGQLESALGLALERAGLQRVAAVYVRSSLGAVVLFGRAPTQQLIDDTVRQAARVPGVRAVTSRIEVAPGAGRTSRAA